MNILTLYMIREIVKGSLIALLILITLFNLGTLNDELKDLGKGDYGLHEIFWYLFLTTPRLIYELIPYAALLGSLFIVGNMANDREIVAMRSAGLSLFWLIRTIILAGLILVGFSIAVGEFLAPSAERAAQVLKTTTQNNNVVMSSQYGMWFREDNQFINVRKIYDDGVLGDIYVYSVNDQNRVDNIKHFGSARFENKSQWQVTDIFQSHIARERITADRSGSQVWNTSIDPDLMNIAVVKSDNLSLYDLLMYINFLRDNNQKTQTFELAFWGRIINPFVTFVMLMITAPFVIGIRERVGNSSRLVIGALVGLAFNSFDRIAGYMGLVYGLNPMLMAVLPSLLVFSIAMMIIRKLR